VDPRVGRPKRRANTPQEATVSITSGFVASAGVLAQAAPAQGGGAFGTIILIVLMIGIFYLMLWRPQQKQAKQHREMLASLKKGDAVIVGGGLVGRIHSVAEKFMVVELARDVRIRVLPNSITARAPERILEESEGKTE
jgi:preprotein translocase subunit YajC